RRIASPHPRIPRSNLRHPSLSLPIHAAAEPFGRSRAGSSFHPPAHWIDALTAASSGSTNITSRVRLQRVRILVADLPGMLAEILRAVAEREPGLEVIEDPEAAFDLAGAVERAGVDVVVVGGNCDDAAPALALLHA